MMMIQNLLIYKIDDNLQNITMQELATKFLLEKLLVRVYYSQQIPSHIQHIIFAFLFLTLLLHLRVHVHSKMLLI